MRLRKNINKIAPQNHLRGYKSSTMREITPKYYSLSEPHSMRF